MTAPSPPPGPHYWLLVGGIPAGPLDAGQILVKLRAGQLDPQTACCPVGGSTWTPLARVPGLGAPPPAPLPPTVAEVVAFTVAPLPPVPAPEPLAPRPSPLVTFPEEVRPLAFAWSPVTIALLGLAFSPVWAGIMAAVNARRLGLNLPWWRPVGVGAGWVVLSFALENVGIDYYPVDLGLYLFAVLLIWLLDLRLQADVYPRHVARPDTRAGWVVPVLAGLPLGAMVFYGLVVEPLRPLEPREVAQRFMKANSEQEMKRYTTLNLWPALLTLAKLEDTGSPPEWELTDEAPAAPQDGGYLVGFRFTTREAGQHHQMEGVVHLVPREGVWKVEEMYFTAYDRQALETPFALSRDYQAIATASKQAQPPVTNGQAGKASASAKGGSNGNFYLRALGMAGYKLVQGGGAKAMGLALLAGLAGLWAVVKNCLGRSGSTDQPR